MDNRSVLQENNKNTAEQTERISDDENSYFSLEKEISDYIQRERSDIVELYDSYPGTETLQYDFVDERKGTCLRSTNLVESTSHLIKGCLGVGMLGMHEAYMKGGIWTSLAATVVIAFVVPYTMLILIKSAHKMYVRLRVPRLTYPDLAEAALATGPLKCCRRFSKVFRYTIDLCLFMELCGTCCVYQIIIAQTLKQALEGMSGFVRTWQLSLKIYIVITMVPLILICLIRSLKYLAPFSLVADISIGICIIVTLYYAIRAESNIHDRPGWKSMEGMFKFLGVCIFSVANISIVLPIENHMKNPKYFTIVLQYGMTIVFVCVTIVGFFGYWAWGEQSQTPITVHLPVETALLILQCLLSLMFCVTFALNFWVPFRVVWHYVGRLHKRKHSIWERLYRTAHVVCITAIAALFPNVHSVMVFLGNFLLAWNGFIFPAFIESLVTWKEHRGVIRWMLIKNTFIVLFGLVLSVEAIRAVLFS